VIENKIFEVTDRMNTELSSGMTTLCVMVACARSVGWGRYEELTLLYLVSCPSALMYSMQSQGSETFLTIATDHNLH
jgi:hypothetical protein